MWSDLKRAVAVCCGLFAGGLTPWVPAVAADAPAPSAASARVTPVAKAGAARPVKSAPRPVSTVKKRRIARQPVVTGYAEIGEGHMHGAASYYGHGFKGRRTASGERFAAHGYTAASNRFPLGSWVEVWRVDNGRCALVKVNDRMAGHRSRLIDVSRGAAEHLRMVGKGVVKVRLVPLAGSEGDAVCRKAPAKR